ncbi:hypothetical protein DAEQUDRAFT_730596 [Daedalea quercina L-15889]|uniref:Uncharacterized protein n=1 Tax=Daedalea quercina L-15889 TaxID=1314783 RepID=A0A165MTK4_9APHY|nr:hypothetical protein DAEQUDRAFT_730596 [Daedalea quercina L-15889]
MGRKQHHELRNVVEERDARLESEVHVYAARASQLQARLLATLDKMDALRAKHIEELDAEKRVSDILSRKLDRYKRYVKEERAEWDDTREALSIVIEKVELANDYSLWPHSQMCMPAPLEPLRSPKAPSFIVRSCENSVQPYAKAIITSLREDLELERNAHAQTRVHAEAEILSLNARLAQREAELEARILQTSGLQLPLHAAEEAPLATGQRQRSGHPSADKPPSALPQLTREDAIHILELTAARNRELEVEVHHLLEQRDQARQPEATHPTRNHTVESEKERQDAMSLSDTLPEYRREEHRSIQATPLAPDPGGPATQLPPGVPQTSHLSHTETYALAPGQVVANFQGSSAESDTLVPRSTAIQQLQQLVHIFATQLDGFSAERDALKTALAAESQNVSSDSQKNADGPEDKERRRLRTTVEQLTHELNAVRESSQAREAQLQLELDKLRLQVTRVASRESTTALVDPDATARVEAPPKAALTAARQDVDTNKPLDILDDAGDECSMELATPLQPTIVSVREDIVDLGSAAPPDPLPPPLIPLPPSPSPDSTVLSAAPYPPSLGPLLPSIELSPPLREPPPWWPHPRSPPDINGDTNLDTDAARRMEIIERELMLARQELRAKNEELSELRGIVEQLRELIYSGETDNEQDEAGDDR